jgi:chromosome segregation ATPase
MLSVADRRTLCDSTATNIQQYGLDAARELLASEVFASGYDLSTQYVDALFRDARAMHERKLALFRQKLEEAMTKQYEEAARVRKAKNAKRNAKKRAARRRIDSKRLEQEAADLRQAVAQKTKKGDQHTPVGREEMEAMEAKAAALMAQAAAMGAAAEA